MDTVVSDGTWLAKEIRDCCNKAGEPLSEKQFLLIAGYTAALATALSDLKHSKHNIQPELEKRRAPFPDYKGNPIHEGDTMSRADGAIGKVGVSAVEKEWCIRWSGRETIWPLRDWIDHEGQAVVVK